MTAPAHEVLTLVRGMALSDRAAAAAAAAQQMFAGFDAPAPQSSGSVGVLDPDRNDRIALIAARCGGRIAG